MHTATLYRGEGEIFEILLFCLLINFHDCLKMIWLLVVFNTQQRLSTIASYLIFNHSYSVRTSAQQCKNVILSGEECHVLNRGVSIGKLF